MGFGKDRSEPWVKRKKTFHKATRDNSDLPERASRQRSLGGPLLTNRSTAREVDAPPLSILTGNVPGPQSPGTPRQLTKESVRFISNDPSAGSPTETLLRLLLPLSATVWTSFRRGHGVNHALVSPRSSLKRSIGSSDGRCVQRAGT